MDILHNLIKEKEIALSAYVAAGGEPEMAETISKEIDALKKLAELKDNERVVLDTPEVQERIQKAKATLASLDCEINRASLERVVRVGESFFYDSEVVQDVSEALKKSFNRIKSIV